MVELKAHQNEILRHATAWPKAYRNYYVAGVGHSSYASLEYLVIQGLMSRSLNHLNERSEDYVYQVTPVGFEYLKEHFPTCAWMQDSCFGDCWNTECSHDFIINDGSPSDNGMKYCCYCGKELLEELYEDAND